MTVGNGVKDGSSPDVRSLKVILASDWSIHEILASDWSIHEIILSYLSSLGVTWALTVFLTSW